MNGLGGAPVLRDYHVESVLGIMKTRIESLEKEGRISPADPVYIFGLDKLSFAIRTLLCDRGYRIRAYLVDDEALAMEARREELNFASRYLNGNDDLIDIAFAGSPDCPDLRDALIFAAGGEAQKAAVCPDNSGRPLKDRLIVLYDKQEGAYSSCLSGLKAVTHDELQQAEKEMLQVIDGFCRQQGLRYWVCGGTLLGTVRHKGFIPWDDDIDIFLPMPDYQRFLELFPEDERYAVLRRDGSCPDRYVDCFAKVIDKRIAVREDQETYRKLHAAWVDIFPLVGMPGDEQERKRFIASFYETEKRMWQSYYRSGGSFQDFPGWFEKEDEILNAYDFDESPYVGVLGTAYRERDCTPSCVYDGTLRMPFEDIEVSAPEGYKEYLDRLYGKDWMTPPDPSKRKTVHNLEIFWI